MNGTIDLTRTFKIFNPHKIDGPVHIIGCGAVGSAVAIQLAKLGVQNVTLWDGDEIEAHNISNQMFPYDALGENKAFALAKACKLAGNSDWNFNPRMFDPNKDKLEGIVFVLVDSLQVRDDIWRGCIRMNEKVSLMVETRLDVSVGISYAIDPMSPTDIKEWEENMELELIADREKEVTPACGNIPTIGATVSILSGVAVWQFIQQVMEGETKRKVIFSTSPLFFME